MYELYKTCFKRVAYELDRSAIRFLADEWDYGGLWTENESS